MSERFYAPDLDPQAAEAILGGSEAHHLRTVMRGRPGDEVELFDGRGRVARAAILSIDRREIVLSVLESRQVDPQGFALEVACAMPKGDRAELVIEKCTELGATAITPLVATRSVGAAGEGKLERWRRAAVEAAKQSRRDYLPRIDPPAQWREYARGVREGWMLDPRGDPWRFLGQPPARIAIGPEGGWTDEEIDLAKAAGWRLVGLPGHVLRVETAAIAACALCAFGVDR